MEVTLLDVIGGLRMGGVRRYGFFGVCPGLSFLPTTYRRVASADFQGLCKFNSSLAPMAFSARILPSGSWRPLVRRRTFAARRSSFFEYASISMFGNTSLAKVNAAIPMSIRSSGNSSNSAILLELARTGGLKSTESQKIMAPINTLPHALLLIGFPSP